LLDTMYRTAHKLSGGLEYEWETKNLCKTFTWKTCNFCIIYGWTKNVLLAGKINRNEKQKWKGR
ncbi:MAG: hypothetical protein ACJ71I_06935, partial [Nitrososphaeraceae archaeon]